MINSVTINNIDFDLLKEQKLILINMIQDWGESDDEEQREDAQQAEGLLNLIDAMQDYAIDKLNIREDKILNYDKETV
jgi:hypothetical protein